jgi:hypothetical protein
MFCEYKDLFGKPREGVHKYRIPILDLALIDVIMTIFGAYLISRYTRYNRFWKVLFIMWIISIIMHTLFCVETSVQKTIIL